MIRRSLTAEEFAEQRFELSDGGRWCELLQGAARVLHPPSAKHGPVVLNISKRLAEYQEQHREGYACFEIGLIVERSPDTVLCPAISYFVSGNRWDELDKVVTETVPAIVVEVASTPDRQRDVDWRISKYLDYGTAVVWEIEPESERIRIHHRDSTLIDVSDNSAICSNEEWCNSEFPTQLLAGFRMPVEDVFFEPEW